MKKYNVSFTDQKEGSKTNGRVIASYTIERE